MKNKTIKNYLAAIALAAIALTIAAWSAPASAAVVKAKGKMGTSANLKADPTNNSKSKGLAKELVQPGLKGGTKTKGDYGTADFDNHTDLYISCYADGDYVGEVAPYGDLYVYVGGGYHSLYATAKFDDGSVTYWGSSTFWFGSEDWRLYN